MKHPKHNMTRRMARHMAILAAGILLLASCAKDEYDFITPDRMPSAGLVLRPSVYEGVAGNGAQDAPKTRADFYDDTSTWQEEVTQVEGDDDLKENDLGTKLDVFISGKDDNFWHEFHLTQGQNFSGLVAKVKNETADLLSDEWRQLGIVPGNRYDVYVAVNNTATNGTIGSKEALLALTNQNTKVFTIYGATSTGQYDAMRRMMMDGHVEWTATEDNLQTIDVPLKRAEAKVVVNVMIDPAFYAALKARNNHESPIGTMQWKYVNWTFDSNVFEDGTTDLSDAVLHTNDGRSDATYAGVMNGLTYYHYQDQDVDVCFNENEIYYGDHNDPNNGKTYHEVYPDATTETVDNVPQFKIITYDYATHWGDNAEERAPFVLLSFPFRKTEGGNVTTSYNYFRVPLCDESKVHELKRNHIYKVDATISGEGSTSLSDNEKDVRLNYQVIDWVTDENEKINVEAKKFYYFYVTPKTYDLRGEGTQSVNLAYYAPANSNVQIRNLKIYYYNSGGNKVNIVNGNNSTVSTSFIGPNANNPTYSVAVNSTDMTIDISSEVLANRAVKYISFTAFLTYVDDNGVRQEIAEEVFVKHFPVDNIQNIEGWWSSGIDGSTVTVGGQQYSWVRWGENSSDYRAAYDGMLQAKVYENGRMYYIMDSDCLPVQEQIAGFDKYNRSHSLWNSRDDYYNKTGFWHYHQYKRDNTLSNRYISPYRTLSTRTGNYTLNSAGWDMYDNYYSADYYEDPIATNGFVKRPVRGTESGYSNNHMYVIQISSTSDDYILGRPVINETTHQSQDHVVSPAFMIASQLGALSKGTTRDSGEAAAHCARYMEVATDGTRYTGWRLPTTEEISIILKYQADLPETMAVVLTDAYYFSLSGESVWTNRMEDNTTNRARPPFIRCVRDLSPEEVEAINSKR